MLNHVSSTDSFHGSSLGLGMIEAGNDKRRLRGGGAAEENSEMQSGEARKLLGFSPNACPTLSQVKAAYKRKVLETHPDRFPSHEKSQAESKFKLISEAYSCLQAGTRQGGLGEGTRVRVVRTGVPRAYGRSNSALVKAPFLLLIFGTVSLGGLNAARAYQREKEAYPSHNPFLP